MAAADSLLFHVDTIVVDGKPVAFEDGSASLSGAARYENTVVPSASGNDFASRKRVPTVLSMKMQFSNAVDPAALSQSKDVTITLRDTQSGRRAMCSKCIFSSLGDLGAGSVELKYLVLAPVDWL